MNNRRSLVKIVTRILYASGFVFLIVGLLLSALSTSALAAGVPLPNLAQAPTQITPPNCDCTTVTPKPTGPTPTKTGISKTPAPTRTPVALNLSSICGYTFDNYELWRVANRSAVAVDYVWRVVGTSETGSGTVAANGTDYFTTSPGLKTVRLYVNDQVMDTEILPGTVQKRARAFVHLHRGWPDLVCHQRERFRCSLYRAGRWSGGWQRDNFGQQHRQCRQINLRSAFRRADLDRYPARQPLGDPIFTPQ